MRRWHRWRHGQPSFSDLYPPKSCWKPKMIVMQDIICPCGRLWLDQYTVK